MNRNDILFVELPPPLGGSGHEQTGRRPAIAIQDDDPALPTVLIVPLTSRLEALRFPHTLKIEPSQPNGLSVPSVALLFQTQVVDKRRIVRTLGRLAGEHVVQLDAGLRRMLKL